MTSPAERFRHRRAPNPIVFPVEAQVPESKRHLKIRTALFAILERELRGRAAIGSDQFVYWNARDPRRCLAPDVFVRLGVADTPFDTWKCWHEGGPPHLAIEIVSEADTSALRWEQKLERYHELGVTELVWFDADERPGERLRVWDRMQEDLVERVVENDSAACVTLGFNFVVAPLGEFPAALRLARPNGELIRTADEMLSDAERARSDAERARSDAERARSDAERARSDAERRVEELEAELRRRRESTP